MIRMYNGEAVAPKRTMVSVLFRSLYACYGADSGMVQFWRAGEALLYALGGTLHISGRVRNINELRTFVQWMGFRRMYCTQKLAQCAGWAQQTPVIELVQTRRCASALPNAALRLQEMYAVLQNSGGAVEMPLFADFCVDFSHRLRHGGARCVGDARGVAITTGETGEFACIGGVAVLPAYRRSGYGSRLVQGLCAQLQAEQKTVLTSTVEPLLPFYQANGFAAYGRYCYCRPEK